MDGYTWYIIQRSKDGKHYAHAFRLRNNQNLASFVQNYPDIVTMNACTSMKYAKELAKAWNESFNQNGTYMFQNPSF